MNSLLIGIADKTEQLLNKVEPPFLLIDDGPIAAAFREHFPKARPFDPTRNSFNPLHRIDYKRARDFASAVYTASPEGENTLTVRNGKRSLVKLLLSGIPRLDKLPKPVKDDPGLIEALATIGDLLISPVLKQVLCGPPSLPLTGSVVAKIDRALLGDFDAFILATLLIGQFKGQVIVPDGGFYLRDFHMSLIRQNRLICGLDFLSELPLKLQQNVLKMENKTIFRTTPEDAARLVIYTKHTEPKNLVNLEGNEIGRAHV